MMITVKVRPDFHGLDMSLMIQYRRIYISIFQNLCLTGFLLISDFKYYFNFLNFILKMN